MGNWHIVLVHSVSMKVKSSLDGKHPLCACLLAVWSALSIQAPLNSVSSHDPSFATTSLCSPCSIIIQLFYHTTPTRPNDTEPYNKCQLCKANQDNLVNGYNCLARTVSLSLSLSIIVGLVCGLRGIFVSFSFVQRNNKNVIKDAMQSVILVQGMRGI